MTDSLDEIVDASKDSLLRVFLLGESMLVENDRYVRLGVFLWRDIFSATSDVMS